MKRYETMSKEEILEFVAGCKIRKCEVCDGNRGLGKWSARCVAEYLNEEVPEPLMVRRYQNICCKQDLTEMLEVVIRKCADTKCSRDCNYRGNDIGVCRAHMFIDYLCELEPEREKEWYKDEKYNKSRKIKA